MANSDYTKPHSNVFDLLPTVYQSETNKTISRNLFDRFWSKNELKNVVGTITSGEPDRFQLPELSPHRQAHQLQPLIYNKVATVDHVSSFYDLLNEAVRLGADRERVDEWLSAEQFNFAPPIDYDKLVNYSNYYWMGSDDPQYITIQNRYRHLTRIVEYAKQSFEGMDELIELYQQPNADQQQITDQMEDLYEGFTLILEEFLFNERSQPKNITNTVGWDYVLNGLRIVGHDNNQIYVRGNYVAVFEALRGLNQSIEIPNGINQGQYTLSDVTQYNKNTDQTMITVQETIYSPDVIESVVSVGAYDWMTSGSGFTVVDVLNDNELVIAGDYSQAFNEIDIIQINSASYNVDGTSYNNQLDQTIIRFIEQLDPSVQVGSVVIGVGIYDHKVVNNSSIDNPFGFPTQADPWSQQNKWTHVNEIDSSLNLNALKQAQQPIIEYEAFLQFNEWAEQTHRWSYSATGSSFSEVAVEPSEVEILYFNHTYNIVEQISEHRVVIGVSQELSRLQPGSEITIVTEDQQYSYFTVSEVEYQLDQFRAVVELDEPFVGSTQNNQLQTIRYTRVGDDWKGFDTHWVYLGIGIPTPCEPQQSSSAFDIDSINHDSTRYEEIRVGSTSRNWYRLNQIAIESFDEVRVYVNGSRLYGTYKLGTYDQGEFHFDTPHNAIWLFEPPKSGIIRVECGPAAERDEPLRVVSIRTSVTNPNVKEEIGLAKYIKTEQNKIRTNQYPLFDMYWLDGTHSGKISPLWSFKENVDYPIDSVIQRRLEVEGANYTFDQHLLDDDQQTMYAYKQNGSLQTVWRSDADNIQYIPKYIDKDGQEVPKTDPHGDWEVPQQMCSNIESQNRKWLTSRDLLEHFRSIIANQPTPPGVDDANISRWIYLPTPAYGAGGMIKQFNDGFDIWLSSQFIKNINPAQLIEFAKNQYLGCMSNIITQFVDNVDQLLLSDTSRRYQSVVDNIAKVMIDSFESNEYFKQLFGDSTMKQDSVGITGWVATMARFGMVDPTIPTITIDPNLGLIVLTHHDGHKSSPRITNDQHQRIISRLIKSGIMVGTISQRPSMVDSSRGQLFYAKDTKQLFRNSVSDYSASAPAHRTDLLWYNTAENQLYLSSHGTFYPVPDARGWTHIDLSTLCADILLYVETQLYEACRDVTVQYPVTSVTTENAFDDYRERAFWDYARLNNNAAPLANSQFDFANPFSWNYKYVDVNSYNVPTPQKWDTQPPSTWYNMYEDLYGTRFPHLEPWKLQFFNEKPSWWDSQYQGVDRPWSSRMWSNIRDGVVPAGEMYPNGSMSSGEPSDSSYVPGEGLDNGLVAYSIIPVNQTDQTTTDGAYYPDDIIPPFYASNDPQDQDVITYGSLLTATPNQADISRDYQYGDNGPYEDSWSQSIHYLYELAKISYAIQPMRFMYHTFGDQLAMVDGVQVDVNTNMIPSHVNTVFHGDWDGDRVVTIDGMNQWYVNFCRFREQDLDSSELRPMWVNWKAELGYQISSFIDPDSLTLRTDANTLDATDYDIVMKHTTGYRTLSFDALRVSVASSGMGVSRSGVKVPNGKGDDWSFRITTTNPAKHTIKLYGTTLTSGTTFNVLDRTTTSTTWNHYVVDKNQILTFTPGTKIESLGSEYVGIQGLVNFIDGYSAYLKDQGFVFEDIEYSTIDPDTGRTNGWQLEIEKLINQIYSGMSTDSLPTHFIGKWNYISVDVNNNTLTSMGTNPAFKDGEMIQLHATGTLPSPLKSRVMYEVVNVQGNTFQLQNNNQIVQLTSVGRGVISAGLHYVEAITPQSFYEVNPCREFVVVKNESGVLSNIHRGTNPDVDFNNGILDNRGNWIDPSFIQVSRGDKTSMIRMKNSQLSIGSFRGMIDAYEHVILLQNTSLEQGVLFDPFLGITINKLYINMRVGTQQNLRPNVGGRFLHNKQLVPNIESSIQDLQLMYDAYGADEDSTLTQAGRTLLGFQLRDYLTKIGITPKSQFLFYRGMIHQKGSVNAINAFINLRLFIDAKVDEYWAYKVNEFGDAGDNYAPEMHLYPSDTYSNQLRLQFIEPNETPRIGYTTIAWNDLRWVDQPLQRRTSLKNGNYTFNGTVIDSAKVTGDQLSNSPFIKLNTACEQIEVVVTQKTTRLLLENITTTGGSWSHQLEGVRIASETDSVSLMIQRGSDPSFYPVGSSSIQIDDATNTIEVFGFDGPSGVVSIEDGDTVELTVKSFTLKKDVHYSLYNGQLVYFDVDDPMQDFTMVEQIHAYGIRPDIASIQPIKVVDTKTASTINTVTMWDPKNGSHYYNAISIVDVQGNDPAVYSNDLAGDVDYHRAWHKNKADVVWMDTTLLSYVPYTDTIQYPNIEQRLQMWGKMEPWSDVQLYQWVQSPVSPDRYQEFSQDNDNVPGGQPKQTLYKRVRDINTQVFGQWQEVSPVAISNIMPVLSDNALYEDDVVYDVASYGVEDGQPFYLYRNGELYSEGQVNNGEVDISLMVGDPYGIYSIYVPLPELDPEVLEFDPDVEDDLNIMVDYKYDYKYTREDRKDPVTSNTISTYYFWASNTKTNRGGVTLTTAQRDLVDMPESYAVVDHYSPTKQAFTCAIIRGLANRVTTDGRYVLRLLNNTTLRDKLEDGKPIKRNVHTQWMMFRERQKYNIDRWLWNKLVESCSGRTLDTGTSVPSLDYRLYDEQQGTTSRYGLEQGQTMLDSDLAIRIVIDAINDPNYDLSPIDRVQFFESYSFDTPDNIERAMAAIYDTFLPQHVNRIWFAVLYEALAKNVQFNNIMKTSWIQLDGVRLLDRSGVLQ